MSMALRLPYSILLLSLIVIFPLAAVATQVDLTFGSPVLSLLDELIETNRQDSSLKGVKSNGVQVFSEQLFVFVEGILRTADKPLSENAIEERRNITISRLLAPIDFGNGSSINDVAAGLELVDFISIRDSTPVLSSILVTNERLSLGPGMFCLNNSQCASSRKDDRTASTVCTELNGNGPQCNNDVALGNLRWLFVVLSIIFVIAILRYVYNHRKNIAFMDIGLTKVPRQEKPNRETQTIINTLASQCASAETLLFNAVKIDRMIKRQEKLLTIEARREYRLFRLVAEYFAGVTASMVILTHDFLHQQQLGVVLDADDDKPCLRALQIKILQYVAERIHLALASDPYTEASLTRIVEAYIILKKISANLCFVGLIADEEAEFNFEERNICVDESFYDLSTNLPDLGQICIASEDAESEQTEYKVIPASLYLKQAGTKKTKTYSLFERGVVHDDGYAFYYNFIDSGSEGNPIQSFVRYFWEASILEHIEMVDSWVKDEDELTAFVNKEEKERMARIKETIGAEISDDNQSVYFVPKDTTVHNVKSLLKQGLSVAGQPNMPFVMEEAYDGGFNARSKFSDYFPNAARWPRFYTLIFVLLPISIFSSMLSKINKGSAAIDKDGNPEFKARIAGFGRSFLGVPAYYFLDGFIPTVEDLVFSNDSEVPRILNSLSDTNPFNTVEGNLFISNNDTQRMFEVDFDGDKGREPDIFVGEIQAGILAQADSQSLQDVRDRQSMQKIITPILYSCMHTGAYFLAILPITMCRESLEIINLYLPIGKIFPIGLSRDLHISIGTASLSFVFLGASIFVVMLLNSMGIYTPFSGFSGDPNTPQFNDFSKNVLFLRQVLLPLLPFLFVLKNVRKGPSKFLKSIAPKFIHKWYFEINYVAHLLISVFALLMLVIYRPQVFYWVGGSWSFTYLGNKFIRLVRTRRAYIHDSQFISYIVEDRRELTKQRFDVLRLQLKVSKDFPKTSRGQAVWVTVPSLDLFSHPFTLAKGPSEDDNTITLHIGIQYMPGDDIVFLEKPDSPRSTSLTMNTIKRKFKFTAELPRGWYAREDPETEEIYYYNPILNKSQWERPHESREQSRNWNRLTGRWSLKAAKRAILDVESEFQIMENNVRGTAVTKQTTWTQKLANLAERLAKMDPETGKNASRDYPVYVSSPVGNSLESCLDPALAGSIVVTTNHGLPAAESCVRSLLSQAKPKRLHFFMVIVRQANEALYILEMLRDSVCKGVVEKKIDISCLNQQHSHVIDWLGVYVFLSHREIEDINEDRELLFRSVKKTKVRIPQEEEDLINEWMKSRILPGKAHFHRAFSRIRELVLLSTGNDKITVGYCGSASVAKQISKAVQPIPNMKFTGEYI
mmetsp:Transcript_9227/g.10630  ORF Transcript_9227/g.10630 Transcript_9227/m.10630 type:complete len:1359 (-) Transcript_9227:1342-5418(-)